jgi:hypothetical protein
MDLLVVKELLYLVEGFSACLEETLKLSPDNLIKGDVPEARRHDFLYRHLLIKASRQLFPLLCRLTVLEVRI